MHDRVRHTPERILRQVGALLILLALIGPLSIHRPATAAQGNASGELTELWTYEPSDALFHDPEVSGGLVLAASEDSDIHVIDRETGEALWHISTLYLTSGPYMQVEGELLLTLSAEPLQLHAIEITPEGPDRRWSVELDTVPESPPPSVTEDGLVILLLEGGQVVAFDVDDGSEEWRAESEAFIYTTGYLYADGTVVVGTDEGLAGLDAATGEERWRYEADGRAKDLVASDGILFGSLLEAEDLFAIDLATGEEVWRVAAPTAFNVPLVAEEGLVFVDHLEEVEDETFHAIMALDAESGDEQYTIMSPVGDIASAVIQEGLLYLAANNSVGQEGAIEIYALEDGTLISRTVIDAHGIAVEGNTLYAPTYNAGNEILLHAFEFTEGETGADGESAATGVNDAPDLAAMALTPWDLADAGFDEYGHGFSEMVFLDAFAAMVAADRGLDEDEVREQLEDAGFLRAYYAYFYSPADDEDVNQMVVSYVFEFADDDGAAAAWEFLEDESDNDDAEDLDGFDDLGDASEATLYTGDDPATGDPYAQLDTSLLTGNLHTGVAIVDWNGDEPDEDQATDLIGYALEQVEDGLDAAQPALSNQVVRLTGGPIANYNDTYTLRDGEAIWFNGETSDTADDTLDAADEAGQTEEYRVWQRLASWSDDPADSVWYYLSVRRFDDEEAAAGGLSAQQDNVESDEAFTDIELDEADYGDSAFTYTALSTVDDTSQYRGIAFQLGDLVVTLDLSGPVMPAEDAIDSLADAQLACLEDEGCVEPVEYPAELEDYLAEAEDGAAPDDEGTPEADEVETPEAGDEETPEADDTPEADETPEDEEEQADGGPVIYEGQMYGFAVEYNSNDWRIVPEDDPAADDDDEWVQFLNDISTVWMVATQRFAADELGDCVDHYRVELGWEDSWELEPLDELTEDDDRAFASYTMVDVLFGLFGYLSIECRPIDSDTVLMITHFAGADAEGEVPEDEVAAVEELKDGIVISGNTDGSGDEASASADEGVYVSEEWSYTVTWDPEYWAESDENLEDGVRLGYRFNTLASVTIFRIASDNEDAESCLNGIIEQANEGNDEGESELIAADDLPVPETAGDAAGGVYMLGDFATMYFECRPLAEGDGMLRIAFGAPDENWEELLPYLEDVLAGIEITTTG